MFRPKVAEITLEATFFRIVSCHHEYTIKTNDPIQKDQVR